MALEPDREAWLSAGGDASRLALYRSIGTVAPFSNGEDRALAAVHPALPTIGTIGDWVGGTAVLEAAEGWLRAKGCTVLRGPMELCAWFPHRANLGPYDESPFALEPTERPERWTRAGYKPVANYVSALGDFDGLSGSIVDRVAALSSRGWSVRQLEIHPGEGRPSEATFAEAVGVLHRIASEAYADTYGYAPITLQALQAWYAPFRRNIDPRLVMTARTATGEPAGVLFALPDSAQPARGWYSIHALAVRPEHRNAGIGSWLVASTHQSARKAGYKGGVYGMVWERGDRSYVGRAGARVFRHYALFEKHDPG